MAPLLLHGARTPERADIAIIEGVMGLFDGQIGSEGFASAHVASLVRAPVIMVIDISHTSVLRRPSCTGSTPSTRTST